MNESEFLLGDLLTPAHIELNLRSSNRDDTLRELAARIVEIADRPDLQQTLVRAFFIKKSQATPKTDLDLAKIRMRNK